MRTFVFYEQIGGKTYSSNFKCQDMDEAEMVAEAADVVLVGEIQEYKMGKFYGFIYDVRTYLRNLFSRGDTKG